ncbi:DUF3515 domain-containing protein [Leucobacter allii]|uniref:DUF3515 domain-containing protein n=1 Tax=Leucobacter allii TaxID=2932247 RepID=A0ABY4FR80_9MICO|nr:DUF3515 family protein [Leucobacter allii]UOQ58791.1 DUF3515 domain-containing protein [Leucobacter allii]UOR03304.1 DUF3515 domain-containing protein [Leucobacter allii]
MKFSGVRLLASTVALLGAASLLTACAPDVPMEAAPDANNPACADVIVRLPDTVAGQDRRFTNAQATGAWGDDAAVQLSCGIEAGGPTTDECVNVNGVDWVIDDSAKPIYRFEAYGRSPGLVVFVDSAQVSGTEVAVDLSAVVQELPQERRCTSLADTWDVPENAEG